MKSDAPPKGVPAFGLVNPETHKARLVLNTDRVDKRLLDFIYHMLKHENVHVGQKSKKKDKNSGEFLGDVSKTKEYFSNKDEVMAFAFSVAKEIVTMFPTITTPREGIDKLTQNLGRFRLYGDIKRNVDPFILKRYNKYIYLYLEDLLKTEE
jgi:hypothetical protein